MSIRLMRAMEVPETPRDLVFRASRFRAVLFVAICIAGCAAMILFRWPGPRLAYYISAAILLLLLALHHFFDARFRPANWLVRVSDEGLCLHFRSYLNDHLSADDPTVAFVPFADICSARLVREHLKKRGTDGNFESEFHRCIELELATDPAPLAAALATECARPAAWEKRWYGRSATLYRDYPVLMQSPPFVRIRWEVLPEASAFLEAIRPRVAIAPEVKILENFADLESLPREQQEKRLRDLDQRGDTLTAVYMARKLYALDLTEANSFVQRLRGQQRSNAEFTNPV